MDKAKIKAALEVVNNIETYSHKVGVSPADMEIVVPALPDFINEEVSTEMLTELVELANTESLQSLYEDRVGHFSEQVRSVELFEIASQAYHFVSEHWAEICFIVSLLERTGKLERLKKNPTMKTVLNLVLNKEEKNEDPKE